MQAYLDAYYYACGISGATSCPPPNTTTTPPTNTNGGCNPGSGTSVWNPYSVICGQQAGGNVPPTPAGNALGNVGWGPQYPSPECATNWVVDYAGGSYPMSGNPCDGPMTTGWIKAVCNGSSSTSGTVSFDISEFGWVPSGWDMDAFYVPAGPYSSSFSVPSCNPAAQENPTSVHWQVEGPHYPQDTVNGEGIGVKWRLVPVVTQAGLNVPIAPDIGPTIHWNGFSSGPTITNYAKDQILGPNTQAAIGHALPQWQLRTSGPNEVISASNSGHGAPVIHGYFYVRTFKHKPMLIQVSGSYTAIWGHWYFKVTAYPTASQASTQYIRTYACTTSTTSTFSGWGLNGQPVYSTSSSTSCVPVWGTFYYPTGITPGDCPAPC